MMGNKRSCFAETKVCLLLISQVAHLQEYREERKRRTSAIKLF